MSRLCRIHRAKLHYDARTGVDVCPECEIAKPESVADKGKKPVNPPRREDDLGVEDSRALASDTLSSAIGATPMKPWVLLGGGKWFKYIHPEAPCWKGEIHFGGLILGWERYFRAKEPQ